MLSLGVQINNCIKEIQTFMKHCGYDAMVLPSNSKYTELQSFVTELQLPMLVSLELDFCSFTYRYVIGISPYMSSETSQVKYHIIDGAHLEMNQCTSTKRILIGVVGMESLLPRSHMALFLFQG
jgi:hypothetical protein